MVELKIKIILLTEMTGNDRNARNYYFHFFIFRFPARLLAATGNCIDAIFGGQQIKKYEMLSQIEFSSSHLYT